MLTSRFLRDRRQFRVLGATVTVKLARLSCSKFGAGARAGWANELLGVPVAAAKVPPVLEVAALPVVRLVLLNTLSK
jgi:hypothetical protein